MKRMLICEDEQEARDSLKSIFAKRDYEIFTAKDGQEAVQKAKEVKPDVILLDIRMPKIDGMEVAREIREFDKIAKLVFITAFQSPQLKLEATKYNIAAFLIKPASAEEILTAVSETLSERGNM